MPADATDHATPGIVMVAHPTAPAAVVLTADAVLGRTTRTADGATRELEDDRMSREHATVRADGGFWVITDHDSRNGTFVNGQRISGEVRRRGDTVLRIGHTVFVLVGDATGHPAPAASAGLVIGPELARAHGRVRDAALGDTLLVHGERGAGKAVAARVFHEASARRTGPFVAVNVATMPEGVADRLLFGARKGIIESIGHFQMARGGTLFLDEVTALPPNVQAKLLRLIERKQIEAIGATSGTPIDVGVVAAGHAELGLAVRDGLFDAELYRRLAATAVAIPPLRDRKVDLARLVQRGVRAVSETLAPHAKFVEACLVRPWPGNHPELEAAVRKAAQAALVDHRDLVRVDDLDPGAGLTAGALAAETAVERGNKIAREPDKPAIEAALLRANGVVHLAARILGIHRSQLYELMEQHGIAFTEEM